MRYNYFTMLAIAIFEQNFDNLIKFLILSLLAVWMVTITSCSKEEVCERCLIEVVTNENAVLQICNGSNTLIQSMSPISEEWRDVCDNEIKEVENLRGEEIQYSACENTDVIHYTYVTCFPQ